MVAAKVSTWIFNTLLPEMKPKDQKVYQKYLTTKSIGLQTTIF